MYKANKQNMEQEMEQKVGLQSLQVVFQKVFH